MVSRGLRAPTGTLTLAATRRSTTSRRRRRKCNYVARWFRNIALAAVRGRHERHLAALHHRRRRRTGPNSEGTPSAKPANGPNGDNHLHTNPYPNTAAPGQPKECEAANEPYIVGKTILGNVPGTQSATHGGQPLMAGRRKKRSRSRSASIAAGRRR